MAMCSSMPAKGNVNSDRVVSLGNGQDRTRTSPWIMCEGAEVDVIARQAISMMLGAKATYKVGFLGYVREAIPITAQKMSGH